MYFKSVIPHLLERAPHFKANNRCPPRISLLQAPRSCGKRICVDGFVSINCFRYLIPLWLVNCDSYFSFGVGRAESNKHVEHMKPSYTALFDVLTSNVLTWETIFHEVGGSGRIVVFDSHRLYPSPSFPAVFRSFVISLPVHFFRSSALTKSLTKATPGYVSPLPGNNAAIDDFYFIIIIIF